jgi:hypothetical protein
MTSNKPKSRDLILAALAHKQPPRVPADFDGTMATGIHAATVEALERHYGVHREPVRLYDPFQCLGEVSRELADILGTDCAPARTRGTPFGYRNENWKEWKAPWGQTVLVGGDFRTSVDGEGRVLIHPQGDLSAPPSGMIPREGWYFDILSRQQPLPDDDSGMDPKDNVEEFGPISEADLGFLEADAAEGRKRGKAVAAAVGSSFGGAAFTLGPGLKNPKGVRSVEELLMSFMTRRNYLRSYFEAQADILIGNLERVNKRLGNLIDVFLYCGTDFGTQKGPFFNPEIFREIYLPVYSRINRWIHSNTPWKVFKHTCGAVADFIPMFIESGFDILNPVQYTAAGMDPKTLKKTFGKDIVFWGGGVDTQNVLPFGTPEEVKREVLSQCEIFAKDGGFVFAAVHNIQSKTPTENLVAMVDALREFNGG